MSNKYFDAVVIGAGFGGIHNIRLLRELGLSVTAIERAPEIGGTWWYNTYPGCSSDTESYLYRYYWDEEDLLGYPWPNRYLRQPEILAYLKHVVTKHDLRKHIRLNTEVTSASWDDKTSHWCIETSTGERLVSRYLVAAAGTLSEKTVPDIPGMESFQGYMMHSSQWAPNIELSAKRVGVIGCGSTGVQIITAIASEVSSLVSFQRNPQYSIPARNGPVSPEERSSINAHYSEIIAGLWESRTGFGFTESTLPAMSVPAETRERIFEDLWRQGHGMTFMLGGFGDIVTNREANEEACKFMRKKISQTIKDPEKRRNLMPTEVFARRPVCDSGFYEACDRDNVQIVNCKETPITAITTSGIQTADGAIYELDIIIFATGFDAIEGSYTRFPIHGRGGKLLMDHWKGGAKSYFGLACSDFPNMFLVNGPQAPFANVPTVVHSTGEVMTELIKAAERARSANGDGGIIEALPEAEAKWGQMCAGSANATLFNTTSSWISGSNIKGRPVASRFFFGGLKPYKEAAREMIDNGYVGFGPFV
ncbi:cyclohexanone monooxygenase [Beauveria brongniartii RCEF 3172]|uniref:Cyclohexanone monooxygenase n=1 Tax=Beauveria brongniartii RCEF 3172 TaxID=1081107 RepID=A0A166YUB5_9HYPO|nr:cyclohexanone monooxygenase [Beauveria brongniartii RCEF 3172]